MTINGKPISEYRAELMRDYSVTAASVESATYQGRNRTHFHLVTQTFGMKRLSLSLFFHARHHDEVMQAKTAFDGSLWGVLEIAMPDGYLYRCVLESAGELSYVGYVCGVADYTFTGMQQKPLVTVSGQQLVCVSTVPYTDVRIDAKTTAADGSLGGVPFSGLPVGQPITVDGIEKRLLLDGAPYATGFALTGAFPSLVPGSNTIAAEGVENVTVSYYPTFM